MLLMTFPLIEGRAENVAFESQNERAFETDVMDIQHMTQDDAGHHEKNVSENQEDGSNKTEKGNVRNNEGEEELKAKTQNILGAVKEKLNISPMNSGGMIRLNKTSGDWASSHIIAVMETNWSELYSAWTTSTTFPSSGFVRRPVNVQTLYTPNETGVYYLHLKGKYNGKEQRYTAGPFKVDVTNPSLTVTPETTSWTNNLKITAEGFDSHSGIDKVYLKSGNDKNIVSLNDIQLWGGEGWKREGNKYRFSNNEKNRGGIYIPANKIEQGQEYVLSFKMRKISGNVPVIGGHLHLATNSEVYIDGRRVITKYTGEHQYDTSDWSIGLDYPNDTNTHEIVVKFKADRYDIVNDKSVHIQINRRQYNYPYTVEIWDVQLEKGTEKTPYEPNSADLFEPGNPFVYYTNKNGNYTFVAMDKAGNTFEKTITVSNIDAIAPSVSLSKNGGNWSRSHSTTINVTDDGGSGLNTIQYRWTNNSSFPSSGFTTISNGSTVTTPSNTDEFYLHVKATDKAGNVRQYTSEAFKVDRTAPTMILSQNPKSHTHDDVTITVTVSDAHSGVKRIRLPNGNWVSGSKTSYVAKTNGVYTFEAEDYAGNVTKESITINNIDKTLSMAQPVIESFGEIELTESIQTVATDIKPFIIKDWRENQNAWRLDVKAERLKTKDGGFVLPSGMIKLNGLSEVKRIKGVGSLPDVKLTSKKVIDTGRVTVAESDNSRGEFEFVFPNNALEITVDPSVVKAGEYKLNISWELVNAP